MKSSGFILLDKPQGDTSFKTLFPLKRLFGTRRVGHAGTLDLRASGLIIAAIGRATRLLPFVEAIDKTYTFNLHLGFSTETLEWDSPRVSQDDFKTFSIEQLETACQNFLGNIEQIPPKYSAIKIGGVRASDLTHRGREVELAPRKIRIDSIEILGSGTSPEGESGKSYAVFKMRVKCSKGTYIRALARDLGTALHTFACVSGIRRESIGDVSVADAKKPDELSLEDLLSEDKILDFPKIICSDAEILKLRLGNFICLAENFSLEGTNLEKGENYLFALNARGEVMAFCRSARGKIYPKIFLGDLEND